MPIYIAHRRSENSKGLTSRAIYLPTQEKSTTSTADPTLPERGPPHPGKATPGPLDICSQYEIISTVMIPAVCSGATWTLSLRSFLWTCKTQVQSTFTT